MQNAELKAEREARATAEAKAAAAEKKVTQSAAPGAGVDPLGTSAGSGNVPMSARQEWNQAVADKVKMGMKQAKAVGAVVAENPTLHAAMLAEHNLANGRRI